MRRHVSPAIAAFVLALGPAPVQAAERVVLVRPDPGDAVLFDAWNRIAAELRIHHFETEILEMPAATADASPEFALAEAAESQHAFAALALIHHGGNASVDVWLVDRASGKTTLRTIGVDSGSDASSVLAIRAVDLLRASLREFSDGEQPPKDVVGVDRRPKAPAIEAFRAPPEPRLHVRAAVFVLAERGFDVAVGPSLGVAYRVQDGLELGLGGAGPLIGGRLDTARGAATLQQELVWADVRLSVIHSARVDAGVYAAAGAYFLSAEGAPVPPLRSHTDHVAAAFAGAGLHAEIAISRAIAAGAGIQGIAMAPRVGVAVGPESKAIEPPAVAGWLGIRVGL